MMASNVVAQLCCDSFRRYLRIVFAPSAHQRKTICERHALNVLSGDSPALAPVVGIGTTLATGYPSRRQ
jgi:hypothetical protein